MPPSRTARLLLGILVAAAAGYALALAVIVPLRVAWPFEIEWMEGGELLHAVRLRLGHPIYAAPTADFTAFFYTPLYPAVVSALSRLGIPLGFALGRAVSALATAATMGMLYAIGAREAGRVWGVVAACLYAAMFRFCGAFYDLVRPDALAMALALGAAFAGRYAERRRDALAAAALIVAAFFAKQTAAVFAPAIALALLARDRRLGVTFAIAAGAAGAGVAALFDATSDGWFWFYVFQGHQGHRLLVKNLVLEYWRDVLFLAPALLLFPAFALSRTRVTRWLVVGLLALLARAFVQRATTLDYPEHMYYRELWYESPRWLILVPPLVIAGLLGGASLTRRPIRPIRGYWLLMAAAGALASALNHSTQWAYANCFMPVAVFGALAVALTAQRMVDAGATPAVLGVVAVLAQLVALGYDPRAQVPSAADRAALATFDRRLASLEGAALVPSHPFAAFLHDGKTHLHEMSTGDVAFRTGIPDLGRRMARGEWRSVIMDEGTDLPGLSPSFYLADRFRYDRDELYSRTGLRVRPLTLWRWQDRIERPLSLGITGNFEAGSYAGWTADGAAFGDMPARQADLGALGVLQGDRAASSRHARDPGTLASATFVLRAPRVTFLVAGGPGTYVRAMHGDDEVGRVQPTDAKAMAPRALELDAWVGQPLRVEIVDEGPRAGEGDHLGIVVDDLRVGW